MPKTETQKFHDFSGGFDAREQAEDVDLKASPYSINVDIDRQDRIVRVPGTSLLEAMGARSPEQLIIHAGLDLRSELLLLDAPFIGIKRETATVWTDIALDDGIYYYASYGPTILFSNGKGKVKKHEAGAATFEDTNVTQGADMCVFAGRLYVGGAVVGGQTQPMGVDWSGPDNFDDHISGLGYGQEILLDDQTVGDHIIAMRAMNLDYMAILCRYGIWAGIKTGDPLRPADFQPKVKGLGCAVRETARNTLAGVLYLSDEGVCLFDGNNSTVISPQINDLLLPLDVNQLHRYRATYNPQTQQYVLFTPTFTFVLDAVRGRWHRRSMTPLDGVPFPLQFHATTWAEMVGTWADHEATGETWKDLAPAESKAMRMVFIGVDLHQEDATSLTQMDVAVQALWGSKKFEAPQNDRLVLTQWARIRYQGSGTIKLYLSDFNREYALSGADIILSPSANPRLAKAGRSYTGLGLGIQLELLNLETKIHSLELDWVARGPRITNDVGVADAVVIPDPSAGGSIIQFVKPDFTVWAGKSMLSQAAPSALLWNAATKRYCRYLSRMNGIDVLMFKTNLEPRALVDPSLPPSGIVLFVSDLVRAEFTTLGAPVTMRASFTLGQTGDISNTVVPPSRIGFQAVCVAIGVQPNWFAYYSNFDHTIVYSVDTGVRCDTPHLLQMEFDGIKHEIRWRVDGVKVASYSPAAGSAPGQIIGNVGGLPTGNQPFNILYCTTATAVGNSSTTTMEFLMAGVPLVTYQFPSS